MTAPDHQLHLFSPIKKAITKERIEQARKLCRNKKTQAEGLEDLIDMLEVIEKRIVNKK